MDRAEARAAFQGRNEGMVGRRARLFRWPRATLVLPPTIGVETPSRGCRVALLASSDAQGGILPICPSKANQAGWDGPELT